MRLLPVFIILLTLLLFTGVVYSQTGNEATPVEKSTTPAEEKQQENPIVADEIELICPVDGSKVKGYEIKSFFTTGTDRDLCQLHAGNSLYSLWVNCSQNGYCGYKEDFGITLSPKIKKMIIERIKPNFNPDEIGPWDKYEITAKIYELRGKPEVDIANAYLRGTYAMRNVPMGPGLRIKEKYLREMAIKYFRKAETKGQFKLKDLAAGKYLIGELYRRNEKYSKAIRYFEDSLKLKNRPDWLDNWANEQMAKAIAEYSY